MTDKALMIIEKDGKAAKDKDPNLSAEVLRKLYVTMVTTRIMDDRALALQRQGRIGFYLMSTGQEASHIGSAYAMRDSDWFFPAYRQPGIMLLRGADIDDIVNEWFGNDGDPSKGRQMPVHYSLRCGQLRLDQLADRHPDQPGRRRGHGRAKIRKDDTVFMTYFGDGGTSSNDFHCRPELRRRCYKSPVRVRLREQPVGDLGAGAPADRVRDHGRRRHRPTACPACASTATTSSPSTGSARRRSTGPARARARRWSRPSPTAWGSHSSSDDASRYRDQEEYERGRSATRSCASRSTSNAEGHLGPRTGRTRSSRKQVQDGAQRRHQARRGAPSRPSRDLFEDVYMNRTPAAARSSSEELLSSKGPVDEEHRRVPALRQETHRATTAETPTRTRNRHMADDDLARRHQRTRWRPRCATTTASSSSAKTSARKAASSAPPPASRRSSAPTAASTPRCRSAASSAPRSGWRSTACARSPRSSSSTSSTRPSTRSCRRRPRCATAAAASTPARW